MNSVLVGMFDNQAAAAQARTKLMSAGFTGERVSLTGGAAETSPSASSTDSGSSDESHGEGAISRFFSSIFGLDSDDRAQDGDARNYKQAFERGSYGVSVTTASEADTDKAEQILNDCGAVDIDEQADSWRKDDTTAGTLGAMAAGRSAASTVGTDATRKLQEVEEEIKVGKRAVAKGGVRIFSRMTEVPVSETVRLREEHANVKRTAVDRPATEADFKAFKEGSIEVRGMAEEAVVSKTARVTGEVEVGKTSTEREETINDKVRKTTVEVEQIDGARSGVAADRGNTKTMPSDAENRDPITGEPGAHPVGTGVGAAAGGIAAGAAAGSVVGPVGTVVGAAVGAVAGGLAGKGVAEKVDPTHGKRSV